MISYDDFAKLEIKIGTILSVEIVEGAHKLLKLMVDVGETRELSEEVSSASGATQDLLSDSPSEAKENNQKVYSSGTEGRVVVPRQIISGIREFFEDPQSLVGRQCPFLVNLEPRIIRGFESQGMILAASNETGFALLHPDRELAPGARVK